MRGAAAVASLYEPRDDYSTQEDLALIRYKCGRCGREFTALDLEYMPSIKCPYCGYRVIYKVRPTGRKLVKAI